MIYLSLAIQIGAEQGFSLTKDLHAILDDSTSTFVEWLCSPIRCCYAVFDFRPTDIPDTKRCDGPIQFRFLFCHVAELSHPPGILQVPGRFVRQYDEVNVRSFGCRISGVGANQGDSPDIRLSGCPARDTVDIVLDVFESLHVGDETFLGCLEPAGPQVASAQVVFGVGLAQLCGAIHQALMPPDLSPASSRRNDRRVGMKSTAQCGLTILHRVLWNKLPCVSNIKSPSHTSARRATVCPLVPHVRADLVAKERGDGGEKYSKRQVLDPLEAVGPGSTSSAIHSWPRRASTDWPTAPRSSFSPATVFALKVVADSNRRC